MMKKTLAAIARDRRCQAILALMRKGSAKITNSKCALSQAGPGREDPARKTADNIFADI